MLSETKAQILAYNKGLRGRTYTLDYSHFTFRQLPHKIKQITITPRKAIY